MIVDVAAEVLDNRPLSAEYNVLSFAAPAVAAAARPGQFVMVKTAPGLEPLLRRPFSVFEILRDASGTPLGVSVMNKRIGVGTGLLYDARPGAVLDVLGPLGEPFPLPEAGQPVWLVAGGVGLAPFWTMADVLAPAGHEVHLFYGARRGDDLHYAEWFAQRGVHLHLATEDGSRGDRGFVTVPLARELSRLEISATDGPPVLPTSRPPVLYCCGPTPMMRAVATLAAQHGHDTWVSLEQVMGCGMGGCYSCVVPVRQADGTAHHVRSCLEGPVFSANALQWDALASGHA